MTIHHNRVVYDSIIVTPELFNSTGLTVADILSFADYLRENNVALDAEIHTNDFMHPMPVHGLQVLRPETGPVNEAQS